MPTPFKVAIPQQKIDALLERVRNYPWFDTIPDPTPAPVSPAYLKSFTAHWLEKYDWREQERRLNAFPQFHAEVAGERLHYVYEKSGRAGAPAIILLHGWPNTYQEFFPVIERLAHPERFGGNAADGVDVIVPSMPGFGFSERPREFAGPRAVADRMNELMTVVLGYDRYFVQGGDWGGLVAEWMGLRHPDRVRGLHLNLCFFRGADAMFGSGQAGANPTSAELAWAAAEKKAFESEFQYFMLQAADPVTLSYGIMDSPVGQAAWILDKFLLWVDRRGKGSDPLFDRDHAITEIMIYLVTDTFYSATASCYKSIGLEGPITLDQGQRIEVPVAFAAFPDTHCPPPPVELVRKSHNVVQYSQMARGGHFPALEEPELFAGDVMKFVAGLAS